MLKRITIESDGTGAGTHVRDAESGEEIRCRAISWILRAPGGAAIAQIEVFRPAIQASLLAEVNYGAPEVRAALEAAERVIRVRSGDDWRARWAGGSVTTGGGSWEDLKVALGELIEAMSKIPERDIAGRSTGRQG